jgi:hypothetical protein
MLNTHNNQQTGHSVVSEWYETLSGIEQFLFLTGVFSTLIFAIQFCLTLFGLGDDADADSDDGGVDDAASLGDIFTIRNGVSFLMGFSWGGLMIYSWGLTHPIFVAVGGFAIGTVLVAINMILLLGMSKLKHDGSIKLENAINTDATVTLSIPAHRSGVGKVLVPIQGRLKEYHAVTDGEALTRNSAVTVLDLAGSRLVVTGTHE